MVPFCDLFAWLGVWVSCLSASAVLIPGTKHCFQNLCREEDGVTVSLELLISGFALGLTKWGMNTTRQIHTACQMLAWLLLVRDFPSLKGWAWYGVLVCLVQAWSQLLRYAVDWKLWIYRCASTYRICSLVAFLLYLFFVGQPYIVSWIFDM